MPISVFNVCNAQTVTHSTYIYSDALNLNEIVSEGYFSAELKVTGTGTVKVEGLLSFDGITYLEPTTLADIFTGFTQTSGLGTNGREILSFTPPAANYLKFKITETGGVSDPVVTLKVAIS